MYFWESSVAIPSYICGIIIVIDIFIVYLFTLFIKQFGNGLKL